MAGQVIGYLRVSTDEQNPERQLHSIDLDRKFIDYASGKDMINRPAFNEMMEYIRSGDTLMVQEICRLARNEQDLHNIVESLIAKGVKVEFVSERLVFTGNDSPMDKLMLSLLAGMAAFQRAQIRERMWYGIKLAKARGAYKGRKKTLSAEEAEELRALVVSERYKLKRTEIAKKFGISRTTLYRYCKEAT